MFICKVLEHPKINWGELKIIGLVKGSLHIFITCGYGYINNLDRNVCWADDFIRTFVIFLLGDKFLRMNKKPFENLIIFFGMKTNEIFN